MNSSANTPIFAGKTPPPSAGGSMSAAATISAASRMGATTTVVADVEPNTSAITAIITGAVTV